MYHDIAINNRIEINKFCFVSLFCPASRAVVCQRYGTLRIMSTLEPISVLGSPSRMRNAVLPARLSQRREYHVLQVMNVDQNSVTRWCHSVTRSHVDVETMKLMLKIISSRSKWLVQSKVSDTSRHAFTLVHWKAKYARIKLNAMTLSYPKFLRDVSLRLCWTSLDTRSSLH